jgi:membrane-associated phospholipid phosphatase
MLPAVALVVSLGLSAGLTGCATDTATTPAGLKACTTYGSIAASLIVQTSRAAQPLQQKPDQKPTDQKPADQKPADQKSDDQKPADQKPEEQKAEAQEPPTPPRTGIRALLANLGEDVTHLPAKQNLYLAAIGGGLALGAHPFDRDFNVRLRSHYDIVNTAFAPGKYVGNTAEQVALSLGTYAYGRLFHAPKASHLGMDLLQAQILTEALVQPIKFAAQRERPDQSNRHSFPSGHSAVTFAGATVLERHLGWRKSLLGYGIASYVAASRLHDNRHYLSDVLFGAAVGSIAGRTVVHHAADYWSFAPVSVPGGVALLAVRTR